jgi:hypothetical protein
MTKKYVFNEREIREALKEKYLDKDTFYSFDIKEVEEENYYGDKYKTIIAEATELNY